MFVIILTLSADFLATVRALALELPQVHIDTNRVQELQLRPEVTEAEAQGWVAKYKASGRYDKIELVRA